MNGVIEDLHPHSQFCQPDDGIELIASFKQALAEALSRHWYKLRDLYDTLAIVYVLLLSYVVFSLTGYQLTDFFLKLIDYRFINLNKDLLTGYRSKHSFQNFIQNAVLYCDLIFDIVMLKPRNVFHFKASEAS